MRPVFLITCVVVGCGAMLEVARPRIVPPGNIWEASDTFAIMVVLFGVCVGGWGGLRWYETLLLGWIGGTSFVVWLPDSRNWIGMRFGGPLFDWYLRNYLLFILMTGMCCAGLAEAARAARRLLRRGAFRNLGKCQTCGYDLRGLPEPRCPECGTPFDPAVVRTIRHGR